LSATLRLTARYLRTTSPSPRLVLAHRVLSTPLAALKTYLASGMAELDRGERGGTNAGATRALFVLRKRHGSLVFRRF
jgi:hypothetical protein